MTTEIKVPQLPESVADATLVAWHKQPGDPVKRDENLADLETDKVVLEVPAPMNGVVREIRIQSGTTVTSGQVLAVLEEASATAPARAGAAQAPGAGGRAGAAAGDGDAAAGKAGSAAKGASTPAVARDMDGDGAGKLSPSVRRLVEENKLDPGAITAAGR